MRSLRVVQVTWDDSVSTGSYWTPRDALEDWCKNQLFIITVGFVVKETGEHLTLSASAGSEFGAVISIPKVAILETKELGEVKDPFQREGEA